MRDPFGLDFGAALALGQARGVDMDLLAQALPRVERILLDELSADDGN
ncbi:DUF7697 family protein [Sphingomonas bisphenolicum]